MNQGEFQGVIIILLIGISVMVGVIAFAVANPDGFSQMFDKLNQPAPNVFDAVEDAAKQQNGQQTVELAFQFFGPAIIIIGIVGLIAFGYSEHKKSSNADETTKKDQP